MKYIPPKKLKVLLIMFFGAGIMGISIGLTSNILMLTYGGVINICVGGLFGWVFLNQEPRSKRKRKK